ncbi:MAG: uroporphyrinogen-III C-methyltransferase [Bacteroidota bacterium]
MLSKKTSKISIVGAGPGAIDLITVRGLRALQSADVVLYDALVDESLLDQTPSHCLHIFVGKRAGKHSHRQEAINEKMVQMALAKGHVVRLKGGDPFVFGRGHEELQFAESFGIQVEVIPGISSCISVPELQGVPLTRRGINESFWVITATTRSGALSKDIPLAIQSSATIVILMGLRKLGTIAELYRMENRANLPVMVVQNGSRADEKCVVGTVATIEEKVAVAQMSTPAIIVIGEVVNLHPQRILADLPYLEIGI